MNRASSGVDFLLHSIDFTQAFLKFLDDISTAFFVATDDTRLQFPWLSTQHHDLTVHDAAVRLARADAFNHRLRFRSDVCWQCERKRVERWTVNDNQTVLAVGKGEILFCKLGESICRSLPVGPR